MNVQVIADAAGRLVWASAALPGSTHDLSASRTHSLIDAMTSAKVMTFADKAYQGAGGTVRTPFKRHRHRPKLSARQKTVNKAHARIRARGERAVATLKTWKLLAKLRLQPVPDDHNRASHPRPTPRREPDLPTMKNAAHNPRDEPPGRTCGSVPCRPVHPRTAEAIGVVRCTYLLPSGRVGPSAVTRRDRRQPGFRARSWPMSGCWIMYRPQGNEGVS